MKRKIESAAHTAISPAVLARPGQHRVTALEPARWADDALTIANLGHATLLMNYFGVRVISDPSLFERVGLRLGPFITIGPHRLAPAPLKPSQLQHLDVILVTHAHMDHLDLNSLKALPKSAVVVACAECATLIRPLGYHDVRELRWGERTVVKGMIVSAMGANHWGKRWPWGREYGFNSYVLEKNGRRMLLACDSAITDIFEPLHLNPPDVAVFSIGAYDPWIWNHADPEQVWTMFVQTGAHYLVPIHWGTFRLSKEPMDEPLRRLIAAAGPEADRIVLRKLGGAWRLPQIAQRTASMPAAR
ncbi:MAG: MBL fold metallo-hydrolase [Deltaproteobacteria bacterium]|nr:MBL fold metallo-hydrolase [Deltaproteobacteria bacterium]MBV8454774.1 MBL fold metallo-hydrolase [Deltaproteobacteria bacterium]